MAARGGPRQPGEALSDWLARALADPALAGLREPVRELLPLHYCHRFDPRGSSGAGTGFAGPGSEVLPGNVVAPGGPFLTGVRDKKKNIRKSLILRHLHHINK